MKEIVDKALAIYLGPRNFETLRARAESGDLFSGEILAKSRDSMHSALVAVAHDLREEGS